MNIRSNSKHCMDERQLYWKPSFLFAPSFSLQLCQSVTFSFSLGLPADERANATKNRTFFRACVCDARESLALFILHNFTKKLLNNVNKYCSNVHESGRTQGKECKMHLNKLCVNVGKISEPIIKDQSEGLMTSSSQINDSMVKERWSRASGTQQSQNP